MKSLRQSGKVLYVRLDERLHERLIAAASDVSPAEYTRRLLNEHLPATITTVRDQLRLRCSHILVGGKLCNRPCGHDGRHVHRR